MLVGPSGCGKSTFGSSMKTLHSLLSEDLVIFSSDEIREELWGDANDQRDPAKVFDVMNQRTFSAIRSGFNVVYDATNLSASRRASMVRQVHTINPDCVTIAYLFSTPREECERRQGCRQRRVPPKVIARQFNQLEIPTYSEGWDLIWIL